MRSLVVICATQVTLLVGTAGAGALASLNEDVDGNGTNDRVELTADGIVHIGDGSKAMVKISAAVTAAKISTTRAGAGVQLVVDLTTNGNREAVVLDRGRGWHVVTRFPLGGVGLDREYAVELDVSSGVVRYHTRWDVTRCDDKPALLFAEKLEGAAWKKLDKLPTHVPANATVLTPRLDTAAASAPVIFQAKASSHQLGASNAGELAIPRELDDGRPETTWREDLPSHGEGQFFTFKPRVDTAVPQHLRIVPSHQRGASRPRGMAIVSKQGAWRFELPDGANDAYVVDLPAGVGACVTVVLESARGNGPTGIAELGVYATDERTGGGGPLLARVVAEGKSGATNATAALARMGAAGAKAIDDQLAKTTDAATRRRLVNALVKIQDPAAVASLVKAASEGWVRDRDLVDVIRALRGQVATLRELATSTKLPVEIRIVAVQQLTPTPGGGLDALVELAGKGPREIRHAVIERLNAGPLDVLIQQATAQTAAPVAGDLWRAVTRHVKHDPAGKPAAVTAMLAALPNASDYERRYRLIDGIATHGDAAAIAQLEAMLRGLPVDPHSSALRQIAIRGIATAPRKEAAGLVIAAARDPDPGVRLASLAALATSETDAAGAWHAEGGVDAIDRVVINAMSDAWPEIRRRAAAALGQRCQRPGAARVLFYAVATDKELDVRIESLVALVQCRATGVRDLLEVTWDSSKQPIHVRQQAISLVVELGDKKLASVLVGRFTRWRGQSLESKEAMLLAQSAAATIGRMNAPGAAQALLAALDDTAFPEIVAAAALGLGALGPACPPAAKTKLNALARGGERSAAAARHAAALCGR